MATEESQIQENDVEVSEANTKLRAALEEHNSRLQEVYEKYYAQELKAEFGEVLGAPAQAAYDGVDTYIMPKVDAHNSGGIHKSGVFTVPPNRYIVEVTYECRSNYCGWCYNPDGGYSPWIQYTEGRTRATWRRKYDGKPVDEVYRVYWKRV